MELGRLPSINDTRTLKLFDYMVEALPTVPERVRWDEACMGQFSLGHNDIYGDCVTVTAANMINVADANESHIINPIDDNVIVEQAKVLDGLWGMTILERLKYWRKNPMFGSQIEAFVKGPKAREDILKFIIFTFGAADIGAWMPKAWRNHPQFWDTGTGWAYRPGSWGGHSIPIVGYEPHGKHGTIYQGISWGKIVEITQAAVNSYVDEVWASILPDWYEKDQVSPSGFDSQALIQDLRYVTSI